MLSKKKILVFVLSLIFLVPFLFWGDYYQVGGDDSKLYYLFPKEYLAGFSLNFISDNQLGSLGNYFSQSYLSPLVFLIFIFKIIIGEINVQHLMFGLNLSVSFLSFYLLLGVFIKEKSKDHFFIKITSSLLYTFSIFSYYTIWSHQLFSVYLASVIPISLFLFSKSILEKKISYLFFLNLVLFFLSAVLLSIPWISALLISISPILFFLFIKNKILFIRHSLILVLFFLLLNSHWLFSFIHAPFSSDLSNDIVSTVSSADVRSSNINNILAVSRNNKLKYPLLGLFHLNLQRDFSWASLSIFKNLYLYLLLPNTLFLSAVVGAYFFKRNKFDNEKKVYLSALLSWLIALYFFSVKIGGWGTDLFLTLNDYIPGFTMFRNMYDKFGLALAFTFSFLLAVSLSSIVSGIKNIFYKRMILVIFFILVVLNIKPFVGGSFYRLSYGSTDSISNHISEFNNDFQNLIGSLKSLNSSSRIAWLPLNTANYVFISDESLDNSYYMGVSPLQFLAKTSDFNGLLSFKPDQSKLIADSIKASDYRSVGKLFAQLNIKYLIKNNDINKNIQDSSFFSINKAGDFYDLQYSPELDNALLGAKVADFGDRYSIYEISPEFENEKIYLSNNIDQLPEDFSKLTYKKNSSYEYEINIKQLDRKTNLVFLDPYHQQWELYSGLNNKPVIDGGHDLVFDYANGWILDPSELKEVLAEEQYIQNDDDSIDLDLTLYFKSHKYLLWSRQVSFMTFVTVVLLVIYFLRKRR